MVVPDALRVTHLRPGANYTRLAASPQSSAGSTRRSSARWRPSARSTRGGAYEKKKALNKLRKKAVENADLKDVTPILDAAGY